METTNPETTPTTSRPWLRRLVLAAGTAVVVAAASVGAYLLIGDGAEEVVVGGQPIGGDPMAMCIQYTDEMLAGQQVAFDGTLISAAPDGSNAVFKVHRWFKGGEGDRLTLSAEGLMVEESIALVGATLEVGQRYLVSGSDGFVWACGYTLTYDTALAERWAEVFGA